MTVKNKDLAPVLAERISAFLQTDFRLKEYGDDPDSPLRFSVKGTIMRHGEPVNVQVEVNKEGMEPIYWRITDYRIVMSSDYAGCVHLSRDVIVSDPCYNRDILCMTALHNVEPGSWDVYVSMDTIDSWGERVYVLELFHRKLTKKQRDNLNWEEHASLGVDSGQMSVFDDAHYPDSESAKAEDAEWMAFYDKCCKLSQDDYGIFHAGNKGVGVVCSSGIGDGYYPLDVAEQDGRIVAMRVDFM